MGQQSSHRTNCFLGLGWNQLGWETAAGRGQGCPAPPHRSLVTPHVFPTAPHEEGRPGTVAETCREPLGSSWWGHPRSSVASARLGARMAGLPSARPLPKP